ncbi:MAG: tRNA (adenosine(37)-N6)-dimethylallyltransferase MiaA [Thermoguttaceae bacterium]|jgi:tRNA dimethylallyltransferase
MTEKSGDVSKRSPFANCIFLSGATASGKTSLGVRAAKEIDAEIVSLDSMAIYRGMDIGSAKPTLEERDGIPHHMIDVADPREKYSLAEYLKGAEEAVSIIEGRGKRALFVGGSSLYLKAILFGFCETPDADQALRDDLLRKEESAPGSLWHELTEIDPKAATRLHPNDLRRVVRAIEVYRLTGKPLTDRQTQFDGPPLVDPRRVFILSWPREELYRRINRRVEQMALDGFLEEARGLEDAGITLGPTAGMAAGYREMAAVLHGKATLEEAIERTAMSTRRLAKRQETWFRSFLEQGAQRIDAFDKTLEELCRELVDAINKLQ